MNRKVNYLKLIYMSVVVIVCFGCHFVKILIVVCRDFSWLDSKIQMFRRCLYRYSFNVFFLYIFYIFRLALVFWRKS